MIYFSDFATGSSGQPGPHYYGQDYTEASTGTLTATPVAVLTVPIGASAVSRDFLISGKVSWLHSTTADLIATVTLDGTSVFPQTLGNSSRASGRAVVVDFEGLVITVPGDSAAHTLRITVVRSSDTFTDPITINGRALRAIDLSQVTAQYNVSMNSGATGSLPTSMTSFQSITISGSASPRTFLVSAMLAWQKDIFSSPGTFPCLRCAITRDGSVIAPSNISSDGRQVDPHNTGVNGARHNGFSGILVTIPGDSASHTIAIAGAAQNSISSINMQAKSICAIDISSITTHHSESYSETSSGTLPSSLTDIYTVTIPSSGSPRTFSVDAMLEWLHASNGVDAVITLDGTAVYPANVSSDAKLLSPCDSGDGANSHRFAGIQVAVPGDGSSHTIGIAGKNYTSTSAVTWGIRSIAAVQLA